MTARIFSYAPKTKARINLDCGLRDALRAFERSYFTFHLATADGSITQVAASSGMERTHLYRKLKTLGFDLRSASLSAPGSALDGAEPSADDPDDALANQDSASAPEAGTLRFSQQHERG